MSPNTTVLLSHRTLLAAALIVAVMTACGGTPSTGGGVAYGSPGELHAAIVAAGETCDDYAVDDLNPDIYGGCTAPGRSDPITIRLEVAGPGYLPANYAGWRESTVKVMTGLDRSQAGMDHADAVLLGENWMMWPYGGDRPGALDAEALVKTYQTKIGRTIYTFNP